MKKKKKKKKKKLTDTVNYFRFSISFSFPNMDLRFVVRCCGSVNRKWKTKEKPGENTQIESIFAKYAIRWWQFAINDHERTKKNAEIKQMNDVKPNWKTK